MGNGYDTATRYGREFQRFLRNYGYVTMYSTVYHSYENHCIFNTYLLTVMNLALYMIYSINTPTVQMYSMNYCLRANGMQLFWSEHCQYFIAHVPGLNKDPDTVSFESICYPGAYVVHKDYRYVLLKHEFDQNFGKIFRSNKIAKKSIVATALFYNCMPIMTQNPECIVIICSTFTLFSWVIFSFKMTSDVTILTVGVFDL